MVKVLQLIDSLNVGGAEMLAVNIANGLVNKNISSHLCVTRKEGELKQYIDNKVMFFWLNKKRTLDFRAFFTLRKYCQKQNISIIHAHSTSFFIANVIKIILFGKVKVIWHNHSGAYKELKGFKLLFLKLNSLLFDAVINVNEDLKKWSKNELWCNTIYKLNNFPYFNEIENKTFLKGELGKRIVHVAGLRPVKNHVYLFETFREVIKKHPSWTLHIVGEDYNDLYSASLKEYVQKHNLQKVIFFYGLSSDISHILSQSDIGVLSSKSEGLPVSLLEYGLAKLPVVVTNVGECSKVIENSLGVVPLNNIELFAKKLQFLIENKEIRSSFALSFHKKVLDSYSKRTFFNNILKIYVDSVRSNNK